MNALAQCRRYHRIKQKIADGNKLASDVENLRARLAMSPHEQRAETAVVKQLLLSAPYFYGGKQYNPTAKSLGAGVWSVNAGREE